MDDRLLKFELLKSIRGKRSQIQLSRKLGFRGNQVSRWESGEREMSWASFARFCAACDVDLPGALNRVFGFHGAIQPSAELFAKLVGEAPVSELARKLHLSRHVVTRWTKGDTEPRLEHFLMMIDRVQYALFPFLEQLVDPRKLPSLAADYEQYQKEQAIHYRFPIVDAFLSACELAEYRKAKSPPSHFFERKLGLSTAEVNQLTRTLVEAGMIQLTPAKKISLLRKNIDLRGNAEGVRQVRLYWLGRAKTLVENQKFDDQTSSFGTIVLPSNRRAANLIKNEYYEFYHRIRAILKSVDSDCDRIQVFNFQLFDLSESD